MYFVCSACRAGVHPLDERLGVEGSTTAGAQRLMCLAEASWSFDAAARHLEEFCGLRASDNTIRKACLTRDAHVHRWRANEPAANRPFRAAPFTVRPIGRDHFERNQEDQRQENNQADQTESRQPLGDRKVIGSRGLRGRVVIRVDLHPLQTNRLLGAIDDSQMHRLDAAPGKVHAEQPGRFNGVENGDSRLDLRVFLHLGARRERVERRIRPVRRRKDVRQNLSQRKGHPRIFVPRRRAVHSCSHDLGKCSPLVIAGL